MGDVGTEETVRTAVESSCCQRGLGHGYPVFKTAQATRVANVGETRRRGNPARPAKARNPCPGASGDQRTGSTNGNYTYEKDEV